MFRCITCNVIDERQFCRFFYCLAWFVTVEFISPAVSKQQDVRWCGFRWSIMISINYVWNSNIDRAISTLSFSYCIWNRFCQNNHSILPNFILFASIDTVEFNLLPCAKSKIYMMRFSMIDSDMNWLIFELWILIGLSRLLDTHIAYTYLYKTSSLITGLMR